MGTLNNLPILRVKQFSYLILQLSTNEDRILYFIFILEHLILC